MFFYVDESGHTGSELFDATQPVLYYGVISSDVNLDVLAEERLAPLRGFTTHQPRVGVTTSATECGWSLDSMLYILNT